MGLKLYDENDVQNIANAIREKGVEGSFKMAEMPNAISQISGGITQDELIEKNMAALQKQLNYVTLSGFIVKPDDEHYFIFNYSQPIQYYLGFNLFDKNWKTKAIRALINYNARNCVNTEITKTSASYPYLSTGVKNDELEMPFMFGTRSYGDRVFNPDTYLSDTGKTKIVNLNQSLSHPIINNIFGDGEFHNMSELLDKEVLFKEAVEITPRSDDPNFEKIDNMYVWSFGPESRRIIAYWTTDSKGSLCINSDGVVSGTTSAYVKNVIIPTTFSTSTYNTRAKFTINSNSRFVEWEDINRDNIDEVMWYNTMDIVDPDGNVVKPANCTVAELKEMFGLDT